MPGAFHPPPPRSACASSLKGCDGLVSVPGRGLKPLLAVHGGRNFLRGFLPRSCGPPLVVFMAKGVIKYVSRAFMAVIRLWTQ